MSIKRENLLQHELIGLEAEVVESTDLTKIGKRGIIMNETRNTIELKENGEIKTLPKKEITLSIVLPEGEEVKVEGRKLLARPEERIKKFR